MTKPIGMSDEEYRERERARWAKRKVTANAKRKPYDRSPERRAKDKARKTELRKDPAYREKHRAYCAENRHRYEYVRPPGLQEWQERSWGRISLHTMPHYSTRGSLAANWLHKFNGMSGLPNVYHHDEDRMHQ